MSSLASLASAAVALMFTLFNPVLPIVAATFVVVALLFLKHRDNIDRLRSGTESKIGEKS